MKTVIILGSSGFLGTILSKYLIQNDFNVIRQSRSSGLDFQLSTFMAQDFLNSFLRYQPDVVINLIACTNVDLCERNPFIAYQSNVLPVKELVSAIQSFNHPPLLIHISSDQVYSGKGPHCEKDVKPLNVYGLSKYTSDILTLGCKAISLRTNFYGRSLNSGRKSLSDWLVECFENESPITVFDDVYFNALNVNTLCELIKYCIYNPFPGTYNLGCRSGLSKAQFAFQLAAHLGLRTPNVNVGSVSGAHFDAKRPNDMIMDVSLFESKFGINLPSISSQIESTALEYST